MKFSAHFPFPCPVDGLADWISIVMLAVPVLLGIWLGYVKR
jgi:hypothetical protein